MDDISTSNKFQSNMNTAPHTWALSDDVILPALPFLYPLEKTHVLIPNTVPSLVVSRISKCLKELSIAVTFTEEQITVAKAATHDHVTFNIQLFSKLQEDTEAVIVEIQRSSGCPMSFHRSCQAILRAARGHPYKVKSERLPTSRPSLLQPPRLQRKPKAIDLGDKVQTSLEIASSLLKKDRFDANLLGIQSLRMLTDPETCGYDAAITVANAVLTGEEDYEDLTEIIKSLIKFWRLCEDDLEEEEDEFDRKHFGQMHSHALAIIANSLKLSAQFSKISMILEDSFWLSEEFVSLLLEEMNSSSTRPHDALHAAKCFNILVETFSTVRSTAIDRGAHEAVKKSLFFGQCAHEMLANELEKVQNALFSTTK